MVQNEFLFGLNVSEGERFKKESIFFGNNLKHITQGEAEDLFVGWGLVGKEVLVLVVDT